MSKAILYWQKLLILAVPRLRSGRRVDFYWALNVWVANLTVCCIVSFFSVLFKLLIKFTPIAWPFYLIAMPYFFFSFLCRMKKVGKFGQK